jgi:hypothetical protein
LCGRGDPLQKICEAAESHFEFHCLKLKLHVVRVFDSDGFLPNAIQQYAWCRDKAILARTFLHRSSSFSAFIHCD